MVKRKLVNRIFSFTLAAGLACTAVMTGCQSADNGDGVQGTNEENVVITTEEETVSSDNEDGTGENEESGDSIKATYLGVVGYGEEETNSEKKDSFTYYFDINGEEKIYSISNDESYSIQNKLKENYEYNIVVEDDVVVDVSECEKDATGYEPVVTGTPGEKTVGNFLKTAMEPVGTTLYIYGGGWDWQDEGSSIQTRTLGVSDDWVRFFDEQDSTYTFKEVDGNPDKADPQNSYYPYGAYNEYYYAGLDCSGYLGWTLYNTFETEDGKEGYVSGSTGLAKKLSESGYGEWTQDVKVPESTNNTMFYPGCIMSLNGHVWICLGTCKDGSVVIAHSTPSLSRDGQPGGGVQLGAIGENTTCDAYILADKYMSEYFPKWYERYPVSLKEASVYYSFEGEKAGLFTWDTEGEMKDPDGVMEMTPREVLEFLFGDEIVEADVSLQTPTERIGLDVKDSPDWVQRLAPDGCEQLFVVAGYEGTTAWISMHEKDENGKWKMIMTTPGYVGKLGLGKEIEGDKKTPVGYYCFNKAFGIEEDPGCDMPYLQVNEDNYWCGDKGGNGPYNELVNINDYPNLDKGNSEHIIDYTYQYRYCLNISYNDKHVINKGSGLFLHCIGDKKPFTMGCVAVPEDQMYFIMRNVSEDCVVVIDSMENLGITW